MRIESAVERQMPAEFRSRVQVDRLTDRVLGLLLDGLEATERHEESRVRARR